MKALRLEIKSNNNWIGFWAGGLYKRNKNYNIPMSWGSNVFTFKGIELYEEELIANIICSLNNNIPVRIGVINYTDEDWDIDFNEDDDNVWTRGLSNWSDYDICINSNSFHKFHYYKLNSWDDWDQFPGLFNLMK